MAIGPAIGAGLQGLGTGVKEGFQGVGLGVKEGLQGLGAGVEEGLRAFGSSGKEDLQRSGAGWEDGLLGVAAAAEAGKEAAEDAAPSVGSGPNLAGMEQAPTSLRAGRSSFAANVRQGMQGQGAELWSRSAGPPDLSLAQAILRVGRWAAAAAVLTACINKFGGRGGNR